MNLELGKYEIKELIRIHPRIEQKRGPGPSLVQPVKKPVDERRLTCAYLAGEGDNTLPRLDGVHQTGQCLFDLFGKKQIPGIRADIERVISKSEESFVHSPCFFLSIQNFLYSIPARYRNTCGSACH